MAWPETPCVSCPRLNFDLPGLCRSQIRRHRRYCQLADRNHPDYDPSWERKILESGLASVVMEVSNPSNVPVGEYSTVLEMIRTCEFLGPSLVISEQERASCGCGGRELYECRAGKGKIVGKVTTHDCYLCKKFELENQTQDVPSSPEFEIDGKPKTDPLPA